MSEVNQFAGTCYRCGGTVEAGEGLFQYENCPGVRWRQMRFQRNMKLIEHKDCHTRFFGTDVHYQWSPHRESA